MAVPVREPTFWIVTALTSGPAEGLVEADRMDLIDGRTRRYYRLTNAGATALGAETERLRVDAGAATTQLKRFGLGPAATHRLGGRAAW